MTDQVANVDRTGQDRLTRKQRMVMSGVCFMLLLSVYVLSAGPMAWLHKVAEFQQFQDALEFVYAPLIAIVDSDLKPLSPILKWYISFFR